jgi:glycosyltransferase involved in cell wall biosynthesis
LSNKTINKEKYQNPIQEPFITVVIPVYNEESSIEKCLVSLVAQDFKPLEIIVVDDGSTDNSVSICKKFDIKLIKGKHRGMGAARNLGANNAQGNILALLDADMTFETDYLSNLVIPIVSGKSIATCHWNEMVANWENPWARCQAWFLGLPDRRRQPLDVPRFSGQYRAVRRDFFIENGGLSEQGYKSDISLFKRSGVSASFVQNAICFHHNVENIIEIYREAVWRGRGVAFIEDDRFRRCVYTIFISNNLFIVAWRGMRLGVVKKEWRMPIYSGVHSLGIIFGILRAMITGYYQK